MIKVDTRSQRNSDAGALCIREPVFSGRVRQERFLAAPINTRELANPGPVVPPQQDEE